jgi:hypothetical protein
MIKKSNWKADLKDLFKVPNDYKMTENNIRYHASLVPNLDVLKKTKLINFKITLEIPNKNYGKLISHHNSVNTHILKPKYFILDEGVLTCYVSSKEVLAHTLRSLALLNYLYFKNNISVFVSDSNDKLESYLNDWKINNRILFGRIESIVNFLRMEWILKKRILKKSD